MEFTTSSCIFGHVCIVTSDNQLCGVDIANSPEEAILMAATRFGKINTLKNFVPFGNTIHQQALEIINTGIYNKIPINIINPSYIQRKVWKELLLTDPGTVLSYKDLAIKIERPGAFRAVANACGANPIAIIIPCHRVISSDAKLGGYRWGIDIKKKLLEREGANY